MQRLVEQLKLEAAVERIKICFSFSVLRSPRQLQSSSNTVCKTPAKMPCWLGFLQGAIPSVSPDPALCSEIREGHQRDALKHDMTNNGLFLKKSISVPLLLCG
ncbi:hypothetical protein ASZ78_016832 [Callipepla squamata]|uniref:Uncharacterized protein n=1 Tax=Callipepla squamata TaxID=9009 RepID=A0A226MZT5_CALSU|nr:hypothetical protein ASZ78_016832 [Callipepla squamata]